MRLGEDRLGRRQTRVASARLGTPPEPFPKLSCRRGAHAPAGPAVQGTAAAAFV